MQKHFKVILGANMVAVLGLACIALPSSVYAQGVPESGVLDLNEDPAIQPLRPEEANAQAVKAMDTAPAQPAASDLNAPVEDIAMPESGAGLDDEFDEDLFFDAEALVPTSELSDKGAPSKVNPVLNPGSRLIVTRKTHSAGSAEARYVAAERAMKLGRFESALKIYDSISASNARDPNALMGRAVALQRLGRTDEAIAAYEAVLVSHPANMDAQINLQGLLGKRYPSVALRNLMEMYEMNPGDTAVIAQLAVMSAQLGRYPESIQYLGMAASMEPENANHIFNMAVIADRAGDKKMAVKYYEEALEIDTLYGAGTTIPREIVFGRLAELR